MGFNVVLLDATKVNHANHSLHHRPCKGRRVYILHVQLYSYLTFSPVAKISWQYQGRSVRSRWLNNSLELNFEFYRLLAGGHRLSIRRVTKYSGGTFKCFAENALGKVWKIGQLTVHCKLALYYKCVYFF